MNGVRKSITTVGATVLAVVATGCGPTMNSPTSSDGPMTPSRLSRLILDANAAQKTANPVRNVTCDPQPTVNQTDGSGIYHCELVFDSGGMGWKTVTVAPDGTWR